MKLDRVAGPQMKITQFRAYIKKTSIVAIEVFFGAGYGARTRGLNFGKVACYHYTKPASLFAITQRIIADSFLKVKHFCRKVLAKFGGQRGGRQAILTGLPSSFSTEGGKK